MKHPQYPFPSGILRTLETLGQLVVLHRKQRKMRQVDLAKRLGMSRQTIAKIEKGDAGITIGSYLTALWLLDIPFCSGLDSTSRKSDDVIANLMNLINSEMPDRIRPSKPEKFDDNF